MTKERTRDDIERELEWEKKWKKILLICAAICAGIGIIIGAILGITEIGDIEGFFGGFFGGLWIGTGVGNIISYLPGIPHMFKQRVKEGGGCLGEGCFDSVKDFLIGLLLWMGIFTVLGPIGLLIRFLLSNHSIKKLEKELSEFGQ
jgi:hypothetical protein